MSSGKRRSVSETVEMIAELFDIPANVLPWGMDIEIRNDRDVFVGGCIGVSEYTRERVIFNGKGMRAVVDGDGLELYTFADGRVRAAGRVRNVRLERREEG